MKKRVLAGFLIFCLLLETGITEAFAFTTAGFDVILSSD